MNSEKSQNRSNNWAIVMDDYSTEENKVYVSYALLRSQRVFAQDTIVSECIANTVPKNYQEIVRSQIASNLVKRIKQHDKHADSFVIYLFSANPVVRLAVDGNIDIETIHNDIPEIVKKCFRECHTAIEQCISDDLQHCS